LIEFQARFVTEGACAEYLFERRWPEGFVCPGCGGGRAWLLKTKAFTYECADCRRQTSVTAGTIMHASKLPLTLWFWAAFLMATHSNGISALQLQHAIARGRAGAGSLAHIVVSKYDDHLPLYRQAEIFARDGMSLETSTLSGWVGATAAALKPLVDALATDVGGSGGQAGSRGRPSARSRSSSSRYGPMSKFHNPNEVPPMSRSAVRFSDYFSGARGDMSALSLYPPPLGRWGSFPSGGQRRGHG
jgi:hypothetical protein